MRREVQSAARDRHVWPEWHPQRSGEDTRSMHWLEKRRQPSRLWWSAVFGHVNSGQTSPLLGHTSNKYRSSCHLNNMRVDSISCNLWPWQCQMPTFCFHAHIQMCYVFLTTGTFAVFGGTVGKWFTRSLHSSKIRGSLCVDFECFPPCSCPPPPPLPKIHVRLIKSSKSSIGVNLSMNDCFVHRSLTVIWRPFQGVLCPSPNIRDRYQLTHKSYIGDK